MATPSKDMATPTKDKNGDLLSGLTAAEAKLLLWGFACAGQLPKVKVDYDKLAEKTGYKNGASASVMYNKAKRKFSELYGIRSLGNEDGASASGDGAAAKSPKKPRTPAKRKNGTGAAANETPTTPARDQDVEEPATPTQQPKRQRKTPAKKGIAMKVKKEVEDSDGDTDGQQDGQELTVKSDFDATNSDTDVSIPMFKREGDDDTESLGDLDIDQELAHIQSK